MENAIAIRPMIYKEAREVADQIKGNMNNVRHLVLALYDGKGWDALGYANWRDCVTKEFQGKQSYLYYQLEAAQVEKNISTNVEKQDLIPESHLRPLTKLRDNPEKQREAWAKAVATAPEGKVTAAHVAKIVKSMTTPPTPRTIEVGEDSDAVFQLKHWWKKATKKDKQVFKLWVEGLEK